MRRLLDRRRARGDRGAVVVEFALVVPVFFLLILALADFALAELSDSAGSNAAREGARVGILYYDGAAGTTGSTNANFLKIEAAVAKKLAGNVKGAPTVTVRCLNADGTARGGGGSCSTVGGDEIEVGRDLIEVSVRWTRKGGFTGFIGTGTRTDKAIMRIVGSPPTGTLPPASPCSFTASSVTPSSAVQNGGDLPAITFQVTVNDATACGNPLLAFPAEAAYVGSQTMLLVSGNTFDFTMPAGQGSWAAGTKTVTATANGGAASQTLSFLVNNPTTCLLTAGAATPSTVTQTGGKLPAIAFTVTVSNVAACGTPALTFPAQAGYGGAQAMGAAGGNDYSFTLPANQGTWTAQTYTVVADANDGATRNITFIVSDPAPTCTLSGLTVNPASAPVKKTGQQEIQAAVTITVTLSSSAVCAVPTVTVTPGNSGPTGTSTDLTTPKSMSCAATTCQYVIAQDTRNWMPAPSTRTVTVTASGSTVTGSLGLT